MHTNTTGNTKPNRWDEKPLGLLHTYQQTPSELQKHWTRKLECAFPELTW
jgi:hypothetical protein